MANHTPSISVSEITETDQAKLADVRLDAEHFLSEVWPKIANMEDHGTGLKTYAKAFAHAIMVLTEPKPEPVVAERKYKEGLSEWARDILDMALDAGLKVVDYDGILQPKIRLSMGETWHKPPFMELAGRELFVKVPHNEYGHILHMRLQSLYWQFANPHNPEETILLFFYAPLPKELMEGANA